MRRLACIGMLALVAAWLATIVVAQTGQGACPDCGGYGTDANCCTCEYCMGNYSKCTRCGTGSVTYHCKWVGSTCCHYVIKRYKYERKSGQGDTCPCEGYNGACSSTWTLDVTEAYLYSGKKCYNIVTGSDPSPEYEQMDRDPWRCLDSAPVQPPRG